MTINSQEFKQRMELSQLHLAQEWQEIILQDLPLLDEDGYPTEYALLKVQKWPWADTKGWFDFIKSIWNMPSWGWHQVECNLGSPKIKYSISTAGWSGNESIITAMQKNNMLWWYTWYSSRRGGHYEFEINDEKEKIYG